MKTHRIHFSPLFFLVLLLFPVAVRAQFAMGLRPSLSTYGGFDDRRRAEVSLVTGTFGEHSRMEFDFGWGHRTLLTPSIVDLGEGQQQVQYNGERQFWCGATVLYEQSHRILWRLHYFAGFGASAFFSLDQLEILGVDVVLGLELRLKIPLQVTVDYRPMLDVLDGLAYYHTVGLGVRYQFRMPEPEPEPKFWQRWKKKLFE